MKLRMLLVSLPMLAIVVYSQIYLYRRWLKPFEVKTWLKRALVVSSTLAVMFGLGARLMGSTDNTRTAIIAALVWVGFLLYTLMLTVAIDTSEAASRRFRKKQIFNPERRHILGAGVAAAASGVAGYGFYRAFAAPEVNEIVVPLKGLPRALEGFTITQLSDIHVGPIIQRHFLKELVDRANATKPDLIAITGDLVDGRVSHLGAYVRELQALQSKRGTFFITGNHDYYSGADEWVAALQGLGVDVLRNRSLVLEPGLSLAGVDDYSAWRFGEVQGYDLDKALAGVDRDRGVVLLAHQPAGFDEVVDAGVGLQLSGHTHGGQIFPVTLGADVLWRERARGLSKTRDSHIFVSRGCGFVGPPFRIGAAPEIAKIVLISP